MMMFAEASPSVLRTPLHMTSAPPSAMPMSALTTTTSAGGSNMALRSLANATPLTSAPPPSGRASNGSPGLTELLTLFNDDFQSARRLGHSPDPASASLSGITSPMLMTMAATPNGNETKGPRTGRDGVMSLAIAAEVSSRRSTATRRRLSQREGQDAPDNIPFNLSRAGDDDDSEDEDRASARRPTSRKSVQFQSFTGDSSILNSSSMISNADTSKVSREPSTYRGVTFNSRNGKWHSRIRVNSKVEALGKYDTEDEAAKQYDIAARRHHGNRAVLNFPTPRDLQNGCKPHVAVKAGKSIAAILAPPRPIPQQHLPESSPGVPSTPMSFLTGGAHHGSLMQSGANGRPSRDLLAASPINGASFTGMSPFSFAMTPNAWRSSSKLGSFTAGLGTIGAFTGARAEGQRKSLTGGVHATPLPLRFGDETPGGNHLSDLFSPPLATESRKRSLPSELRAASYAAGGNPSPPPPPPPPPPPLAENSSKRLHMSDEPSEEYGGNEEDFDVENASQLMEDGSTMMGGDDSRLKRKRSRNSSSIFIGVSRLARTGRFQARIRVEEQNIQLGSFATEEEAAREYDKGARQHHGERAVLNFPDRQDMAIGRKWALMRGAAAAAALRLEIARKSPLHNESFLVVEEAAQLLAAKKRGGSLGGGGYQGGHSLLEYHQHQ